MHTELGILDVRARRDLLIPRGVKFRVELPDGPARGYICENYGQQLRLPDLGPIGTFGLANARDFLAPVAAYEDREGDFRVVAKYGGGLWEAEIDHSPLDIVAWRGNYVPYKYDLNKFQCINTVTFDHPDPSIYCVLASPTGGAGDVERRVRLLPAALDRGRAHVPSAAVPPQRRQRVRRADLGPVHRQGGRLRARQRQPAQLHVGPRARRRRPTSAAAAPS